MILSIETSGNVCSVAIHDAQRLLVAEELHEKQAHAAKLAVLIDKLLHSSKVSGLQLEAVAVSSGPGSYTGLRIGTSTAKGICYALSIPLISVGSLELMVHGALMVHNGVSLCPMIDARRMEVYCMLVDPGGNIVQGVEAHVIDSNSYQQYLTDNKVIFFGDGSMKCKDVISHPNASFVDDIFPTAESMGELAYKKYSKSDFEDLVHFEPFYLKEFVAKKPSRTLIG